VRALKRLRSALKPALPKNDWKNAGLLNVAADNVKAAFLKSMDDDFNTAGALGFIFEFVKEINQARDEGADQDSLESVQQVLVDLTGVLGLNLVIDEEKQVDPAVINSIVYEIGGYLNNNQKEEALAVFQEEIYSADIPPEIDINAFLPEDGKIDYRNVIDRIVSLREKARNDKDWDLSDYIRKVLNSNGIQVEDSDQGSSWYLE
jgi:cysteinyl-tRNA synthetase